MNASPQTFFIGPAKDFKFENVAAWGARKVVSTVPIKWKAKSLTMWIWRKMISRMREATKMKRKMTLTRIWKSLAGLMKKVSGDALKLASEM